MADVLSLLHGSTGEDVLRHGPHMMKMAYARIIMQAHLEFTEMNGMHTTCVFNTGGCNRLGKCGPWPVHMACHLSGTQGISLPGL